LDTGSAFGQELPRAILREVNVAIYRFLGMAEPFEHLAPMHLNRTVQKLLHDKEWVFPAFEAYEDTESKF
jgi:hypothetical protein